MATHYIPRNVKGEGRILYIFTTKALITTAIGGGIGFLLYFIFSIVGIKINYHLLTSIYVTSILSYTVLEDDANDEK